MTNSFYPPMITVVNCLTIIITAALVVYTYRKCFILSIPTKDHAFYKLKLMKCTVFFIFNGIALYVNYRIFSVKALSDLFPYDLVFLRYVDRATVLIYAFIKILDCVKYSPSAYEKISVQKI